MTGRHDAQRFQSVRERDVDLVLLEELTVNPEFRRFLHRGLGRDPGEIDEFVGSAHSVHDPELGESDIEMAVTETDGARVLVMIENKIGAPFQDRQLERYRERGKLALDDGWDEFVVCVTAPGAYLEGVGRPEAVDATIPFEAIHDWFADRDTRRAAFKAEVLAEAIEQHRRGYRPEPDDEMTALHRRYWELARERFPELGLSEPEGVPGGSRWIRFRPPRLPDELALVHKTERGHVDLQFSGAGERPEEFVERYEPELDDGMRIAPTGKSMSVRRDVPPLSKADPPGEQEPEMVRGLAAARGLLDWFERVDGG